MTEIPCDPTCINSLLTPILLPLLGAIVCAVIPGRRFVRSGVALIFAIITLIVAFTIFMASPLEMESTWQLLGGIKLSLGTDSLSSFVLLWIAIFGVLVTMFSVKYMDQHPSENLYYSEVLLAVAASAGAVMSRNWIVFIFFWDIVLLCLYGLILLGSGKTAEASKKTLVLVGISDFALLLGAVLLWQITGGLSIIPAAGKIALDSRGAILAFLLVSLGALTKAGAYPLHTWLPAMAEGTPSPAVALLPASLDKLLGIYLLARLVINVFNVQCGSPMSLLLMGIGGLTVLGAVLMALVQHNLKKLMAFHAISQVGYMVLGIGTAVPLGIAGGLFHMLNHAIYKSCLFLCAGVIEKRTGTCEIKKLGGLAAAMPLTFIACIIASLSISGIPPLNGFYSKWLVYQGVLEAAGGKPVVWIFLIAALFGSALTLASFMKVIFAAFLGRKPEKLETPKDAGFFMGVPLVILALLCVVFGLFAQEIPIARFIVPSINVPGLFPIGIWEADQATVLLIFGMIIGMGVYLIGNIGKLRVSSSFIGGEQIPSDTIRVDGTEFYGPVREQSGLARGYKDAQAGAFDLYEQGMIILEKMASALSSSVDNLFDRLNEAVGELVMEAGKLLAKTHTGSLPAYLSWSLVGLFLLLLYLFIGSF